MAMYKYYTDGETKIIAISTYAGKTVRGIAKCAPGDQFNPEKGVELAEARCAEKISQKRLRRAHKKVAEAQADYLKALDFLERMKVYEKDSEMALHEAVEQLKYVTKHC
jgi:hypothetical protein